MANKKTQKDFFNEIIEVLNEVGRDDLVEFCEDRIDKLSKKSSSKKPTKTQVENEGIKDVILEVLGEVAPATATMIATDPRVNVSNQKVSALLRQLIESGDVVKATEKGKSLFSLAVED
jgi:predicted ArsR family transcriptional regulator